MKPIIFSSTYCCVRNQVTAVTVAKIHAYRYVTHVTHLISVVFILFTGTLQLRGHGRSTRPGAVERENRKFGLPRTDETVAPAPDRHHP